MEAIIKLLLILIESFNRHVKLKDKKNYEEKIESIRNDPIAEWNKRFKRVQPNPTKGEEMSPDNTNVTGSDKRESDTKEG